MVTKPPYQRDDNNRPAYRPGGKTPRGYRGRSLFPLLVFGAVVLFIASREIPWLADRINRLVIPDKQSAIELCRDAALRDSPQLEFARIIRGGEATRTQNGIMVDNLILGELSRDEGEVRARITCHIDGQGILANLHREIMPTTAVIPPSSPDRPTGPPTK